MFNAASIGKEKRLSRILSSNRTLIVPVDDSLIFGPYNGLYNLPQTLTSIAASNPNAILGFKGSYSKLNCLENGKNTPFILNLTASTVIGHHIQKVETCTVQDALVMGVDCVASHINFTSEYENEMIHNTARIISEADKLGMPSLVIAYPRKEDAKGRDYNYLNVKAKNKDKYTEMICHCVRVSVELGADIVKTQYTGSVASFKKVIDAALGTPVVIAGGPVLPVHEAYKMARDAIDAGASGISFGRNVFNSDNISAFLSGMKAIIFDNSDVDKALNIYQEEMNNV